MGFFALLCISLLYFASVHNLFYLINNVIKENIVKQLSHINVAHKRKQVQEYIAAYFAKSGFKAVQLYVPRILIGYVGNVFSVSQLRRMPSILEMWDSLRLEY